MSNLLLWVGFNVFVLAMLALDLGVFHRKAHVIKTKEALWWSAMWICLSLLFNLGIYIFRGAEPALQFLAGYLIEKSLSVDNIFVFLMIFTYFRVPPLYQHKVLFWGILGALIMRAIFIASGVALLAKFHWIIYIFGVFLVFTGIRMFKEEDEEIHPEKNPVLRLFRRFMPVTENYVGGKFFVRKGGLFATPLVIVLLMIETTDLVFALDSIPAILAISRDTFIVYTSNVFAILGLRALYFAVAGIMQIFHYLNYGLGLILIFIGGKMLLIDVVKIPIGWALGVVAFFLTASILASVLWPIPKENMPAVKRVPEEKSKAEEELKAT
jgi:tellurite resistance protein TerC